LYIRALVDEGQKVVCVEDGMPTWMYEMMVTKPTVEEAIEYIKSIEEAVEVPIAKITALK
jgi:adenylosuccinate synthase